MKLEILKQAVLDSRDGITISENLRDDQPLVFVNPAFERMTGYSAEEITNLNCRYLQSEDREQPEIATVRNAIEHGEYCLVTLRNYRKDGSVFWNELSISPIYNASGSVTNFIGIQKDVSIRVLVDKELREKNQSLEHIKSHLEQLVIKDGLTGIYNRRFFDAQFDIQWRIARRNNDSLALLMIDIDLFKQFNDIYGHPAGDEALKAVAEGLDHTFLRGSDFVARYGGEEFVVLSMGMTNQQAASFSEKLCSRVRDLEIPHSASATGFLTVSVGYSVHSFSSTALPNMLLSHADRSLFHAKKLGRNQCYGS